MSGLKIVTPHLTGVRISRERPPDVEVVTRHVKIVTPPLLMVSWSCKRCGHTGGTAKTTFPIEPTFYTAMGATMLAELKKKLVRVHMKQGCMAIPDDFVISRYRP